MGVIWGILFCAAVWTAIISGDIVREHHPITKHIVVGSIYTFLFWTNVGLLCVCMLVGAWAGVPFSLFGSAAVYMGFQRWFMTGNPYKEPEDLYA